MKKQTRKFYMVDALLQKRGIFCEWCHEKPWTDKHHAILRRNSSIPQLDVEENFLCACHNCHDSGILDSNAVSIFFYFIQIARGYKMAEWIQELPLKIKPTFKGYSCDIESLALRLDEPLSVLFAENLIG